jgi:hypothetical protein
LTVRFVELYEAFTISGGDKMLNAPTPYPYVGSYALIEHEGANTLARIVMRRAGEIVVGLPLVDGASGNLRVAPEALIDATPLTPAEAREFHDLDRDLAGIEARVRRWAEDEEAGPRPRLSPKQRQMTSRRDALKQRVIYGPIMDRLLRFARARGVRRAA